MDGIIFKQFENIYYFGNLLASAYPVWNKYLIGICYTEVKGKRFKIQTVEDNILL